MKKKRVFGELELTILQFFERGRVLTVRDVLTLLDADDKYTTIMTVMNRMVEKKMLTRRRAGQFYEYCLAEFQKITKPNLLEKFKQKFFGGKSSFLVSYLLESSRDITHKELEEMEKLIKELKKSR